jgi:hypothetical protein
VPSCFRGKKFFVWIFSELEGMKRIKTTNRLFVLILPVLCLLCGCASDSKLLSAVMPENDNHPVLYHLARENPQQLAQQAAEKGDFRLLDFTAAQETKEGEAGQEMGMQIAGFECSKKIEIQPLMFSGCPPPPAALMILATQYDLALMGQSGFQKKYDCRMDDAFVAGMKTIEDAQAQMNQESKDAIKKWEDSVKKSKICNDKLAGSPHSFFVSLTKEVVEEPGKGEAAQGDKAAP